jgi:hypothetical protein
MTGCSLVTEFVNTEFHCYWTYYYLLFSDRSNVYRLSAGSKSSQQKDLSEISVTWWNKSDTLCLWHFVFVTLCVCDTWLLNKSVSHISLYFQQPNFNIAFVFNVKEDINLTFQIYESKKKNESNKRTLSK